MELDINLLLLDRFRQVERLLRMGRVPGALVPESAWPKGPDGQVLTCEKGDRHLKREMMLATLLFKEDGMRQKDLAEEMRVSPSTISETIGRLVGDGFVVRVDDEQDRRAKKVAITEAGRRRARDMMDTVNAMLQYLFGNLDENEKRALADLLGKLTGGERLGNQD